MVYAGFWRRVVAALVDGILLSVVGGILMTAMDDNTARGLSTLIGWLY